MYTLPTGGGTNHARPQIQSLRLGTRFAIEANQQVLNTMPAKQNDRVFTRS